MSQNKTEIECLQAFQRGNKRSVEQLLPALKSADIRTTRDFTAIVNSGYKVTIASDSSLVHLAALHGWMDVVIDLITKYKCDANSKNSRKRIPLYSASASGQLEVIRYLIDEQHSDPMTKDHEGKKPLHFASQSPDSLCVVKYFIEEQNCDPVDKDAYGRTPIHYACQYGNFSIVQYLINEKCCDPMVKDSKDWTPLHYACKSYLSDIAQLLLSTGQVDPLAKDSEGKTPIYYATGCYDLLKLFRYVPQLMRDFPVHTYTKVILTGFCGAGKTTTSQLILRLTNKIGFFSVLSSGRIVDVECLTAGIIPLHVETKVKEVGNMVIYDFAGQQEYHSSHSAVLERIMKNSAAIFICIVDLSLCMEKISESVHYWMSFIENACNSAKGSSHVIIVGSHADLVRPSQVLKDKSSLVESIAENRAKQLTYGGFVSMDCRESRSNKARKFRSLLSISQRAILASQPCLSFYHHVLYAFLHTKLGRTSCTLQQLTSALALEEEFDFDSIVITESLIFLSDKGLILFVQNQEHPQSSWVVVEKEALLRDVNGTLFAPDHFKQYRKVASNTGIVPIATIEELFPQYSSEMLVGCLENMEFCHPVDPSALDQATSCKVASSTFPSEASHLFFPSLIKEHRPGNLPSLSFGWSLGCSDPHQFFSSRFLHVLLLRLAFTFPLASKHLPLTSSLHGLERQCKVWQNGIIWKSGSGVSTVVEIVDRNRWVIVLVSEKSKEAAEMYSSAIRLILDLKQQLCSVLSTCECLISPSLLSLYPFDALPDTDLFDLPSVARAMLLRQAQHRFLLDRKEGMNTYSTDEALSCEPYYLLQPSSVCQLFKESTAAQPVPDSLLQEVHRYCQQSMQKPWNHNDLREYANMFSLFAGRDPLVSSVQVVMCDGMPLSVLYRRWLN